MSFFGQQLPLYSGQVINGLAKNPGIAGSKEYVELGLIHRSQWMGFDGGPNFQLISAHSSISNSKSGVGGYLFRDKNGVLSNTGVALNYAYQLDLGEYTKLGFGIGGRFLQKGIKKNQLILHDDQDVLLQEKQVANTGNLDFGLYLHDHDYFFAGISAMNLLSVKPTFSSGGIMPDVMEINGVLGTNFYFGRTEMLTLQADITRLKGLPITGKISALVDHNQLFYGGVGYRLNDAFIFTFGARVWNEMRIYYLYDMTSSSLKKSGGAHEIHLSYKLNYAEGHGKVKKRYNLQRVPRGFSFKKKRGESSIE